MNKIPFVANTADGTHCVQAALAIMIKHFIPAFEVDMKLLDKMTHKSEGKGTTWFPALIYLNELGLKTKLIEAFDYELFHAIGKKYIYEIYDKKTADWYWHHSNIAEVRNLLPRFLQDTKYEQRAANMHDLEKLLKNGWLVGLDVNARVLNQKPGFSSHTIVVYKKIRGHFCVHDSRLPPAEGRKVTPQLLLESWRYAGVDNMALIAIRK